MNEKQRRYSSPQMRFISITILLSIVALGCGNGGHQPKNTDAAVQSPLRDSNPDNGKAKTENPDEAATARVLRAGEPAEISDRFDEIFDFVFNLHRAHLRSGGLLIDFGTRARHKYTLGNWKSGWRGDFCESDITYSYMVDSAAHIFFDALADEQESARITFRARAVGSQKAKIFLNGEYLGSIDLVAKEFGYATVEAKKGIIRGQNELLIRADGRSSTPQGIKAALAIDYVRISFNADREGPAAASIEAVRLTDDKGRTTGLTLNQGESIVYNLPVKKGMRLRLQAAARMNGGKSRLEVAAASDSGVRIVLDEREIRDATATLDLGLDDFDDEAVSISLRVSSGEVVISKAGLFEQRAKLEKASGRYRAKNFILILIDTLRADRLSAYDKQTRVRTTALDEFADQSMVFERALAPENWTKPSIASLLSGLYPESHTAKDDKCKVPQSVVLASEHFKKLGFFTAGFVANGYVSSKFGFEQGWDAWVNYVRDHKPNRAQFVMDDVISWIETRDEGERFFLYVHTIDPHVPYIPPRKYWSFYDGDPYSGPVEASGTAKLLEKIKTGAMKLSDRDKFRLEALYDGEVTYHDDQLIKLAAALEKKGLDDNTLVIITADHGEEFFEHGSVGHGHSLYEELLHVPLMIKLPKAKKGDGARSSVEVGLTDVLPTACDILGVEPPGGIEGRSLVPLLKGEPSFSYASASFSDFLNGQRAGRMGRYKIIYKGLRPLLFDLKTDPGETLDLSRERPAALAAMRDTVGEHLGRFAETSGKGSDKGRVKHKSEKATIDPETERQLKALGYMGGE